MDGLVYTQLSELLSPQATASAAEWHGAIVGGVVAGAQGSVDHWLGLCFGVHWREQVVDEALMLERLAEVERETRGQLARDQMEFELALPADELSLDQRTQALADWCSGFLHGFGLAFDARQGLPEEVRHILSDLGEISKAEIGDPIIDETHEIAFSELVEYLRVAIQNMYEGLREERESRSDVH